MAIFNVSPEELTKCQRWFKYILLPFSKSADTNENYLADSWSRRKVNSACARIMQVVTDRIFDMDVGGSTDQAFETLSKEAYKIDPDGAYRDKGNEYKISVALMTKFLAFICLTNHIFWDDSKHSDYEKEYFIQTKLGKALWNANCFMSQQTAILQRGLDAANQEINLNKPEQQTQTRVRTANPNSSASGKVQRTININNCGGLISNSKEIPSTSKMFFIQGEWIQPKKTTPRIYVTPNNAGQTILKVNLSSGQGFDDCVLYFDDLNKANEFMLKCANIAPTKVQNLTIRKQTTDPNGYFKVNTEFGEAFIKAARLGE